MESAWAARKVEGRLAAWTKEDQEGFAKGLSQETYLG